MPEKPGERRFEVRWFLRAGHRDAGHISGHTIWVNTSGLEFYSPLEYVPNDLIEIELCIDLTTYVRCVVRIMREVSGARGGHTYFAQFVSLREEDRTIIAGTLLAIRRSQLASDYSRVPLSRNR